MIRLAQGLLAALAVAGCISSPLTQLLPASDEAAPGDALDDGSAAPGSNPFEQGNVTLTELAAWLRLPGLANEGPVRSSLLGAELPATELVGSYQAMAAGSATPLRDALAAWNRAIDLQDPAALDGPSQLDQVDGLPLEAQQAIATLLYALTDATLLQKEAVAALDEAQYRALLQAPGRALAGGFDPTVPGQSEAFGHLSSAAADVNGASIQAATRLTAAAVEAALPSLQAWADGSVDPAGATSGPEWQPLRDYLALHSPEALAAKDPIERLAAAEDALRMAAALAGLPALSVPPPPDPGTEHPLAVAIVALTDRLGGQVPIAQLGSADQLPLPVQQAAASILLSVDHWHATLVPPATETDPSALQQRQADVLSAQVSVLATVRSAAPTLQAWGLVWQRGGHAILPPSASQAPDALATARALAERMASGDLTAALEMAEPGSPLPVEAPVQRADLSFAVLRLYASQGIEATPDQVHAIQEAAAALPAGVAHHAAQILLSELDAAEAIQTARASLTAEERLLLSQGLDLEPLLAWPVSVETAQTIRRQAEVADRVQTAYRDGAAGIARAVQAANGAAPVLLSGGGVPEPEAPIEVPEESPSPQGVVDDVIERVGGFLALINPIGTASAQPLPSACPDNPLADCSNDVWFADPVLQTVVISGVGSTTFSASAMAPPDLAGVHAPIEGQLLTFDLGGDDVYANNAGGALLNLTDVTARPADSVDLNAVAVALDLGGDDEYRVPDEGRTDNIQGASTGGIGMLFDAGGHDRFTAVEEAQGYASAGALDALYGIGLLFHGPGPADYRAKDRAQGASSNAVHGLACAEGSPACPAVRFSDSLGALIDQDGATVYSLERPPGNTPRLGQAGAIAGLALLVDGGGADQYRNGMQGSAKAIAWDPSTATNATGTLAPSLAAAVLADLSGDDEYTRPPADRFKDASCWASLRTPQGNPFDTADPAFATDAETNARAAGLFLDLQDGQCTVDQTDLQPPDPETLRDQLLGLLDGLDDTDGDGWPDPMEAEVPGASEGTDPADPTDYPAGLPAQDAACPALDEQGAQPPLTGLCASGQGLPYGSSYLVRVPGIFVLGDAVATLYPSGGDYVALLDVGGQDVFRNSLGGTRVHPGVGVLGSLAVDFGPARHEYVSDADCAQGCNSMLLDFGNDVLFDATSAAGTVARPTAAQGACSLGYTGETTAPLGASLLFHAAGRATYRVAEASAAGLANVAQGAAAGGCWLGVLVDTGGDTVYHAPTQGFGNTGLFLDLNGTDTYTPVGRQGISPRDGTYPLPTVPQWTSNLGGIFVDQGGYDDYVGTREDPTSPDYSPFLNDRVVARGSNGLAVAPAAAVRVFDSLFLDNGRPSIHVSDPIEGDGQSIDLPGLGIRIGTPDPDSYDHDYALVIDPAGDDSYTNNAGATILRGTRLLGTQPHAAAPAELALTATPWENYPVASLLIDLGGSDQLRFAFEPTPLDNFGSPSAASAAPALWRTAVNQGSGLLGVGMLVTNGTGTDSFVSPGFGQGAAFLGSGLLWKRAGNAEFGPETSLLDAPRLDRGLATWRQAVGGQWAIMGSLVGGGQASAPCRFSIGEADPVGDHAIEGPADGGAFTVVYSAFGTEPDPLEPGAPPRGLWTLHRVSGQGCDSLEHGEVTDAASNQVHPALTNGFYVWQDDRHGHPVLYCHARDAPTESAYDRRGCRTTVEALASDQTEPAADGDLLVWTERAPGGPPSIYRMDLGRRDPKPVLVAAAEEGQEFAHPDVSDDGLVVWQVRDCAEAVCDWDIMVQDLFLGTSARRVEAPGDQVEPVAAGRDVAFTDMADDSVKAYEWGEDAVAPLRQHAAKPALADLGGQGQALVWMSTVALPAETPGLPNHRPFPELLLGSTDQEGGRQLTCVNGPGQTVQAACQAMVACSDGWATCTRMPASFLQGAVLLSGIGLLFDESGNDRFEGGDFSQGASLSLVEAHGPSHGALVALSGNHRFSAQRYSQGTHIGILPIDSPDPPNLPPPDLDSQAALPSAGLLLAGRGADAYAANGFSQGFGAFAVTPGGATDTPSATDPPAASDLAPAVNPVLGALLDFGGQDGYDNVWVGPTNVSLRALTWHQLPTDPCPGQPESLADLVATCRAVFDNETVAAAAKAAGGASAPAGQDDRLWLQGDGRALCGSVLDAIPGNPAPALCLGGGIGADLSLFDRGNVATAEVGGRQFTVSVVARNQDGTVVQGDTRAHGDVDLCTEVTDSGSLELEVHSVEYFLRRGSEDEFLGYGATASACRYQFTVPTVGRALPDGDHEVVVRVLYQSSLPGQSFSPGSVEATKSLPVDNPPQILAPLTGPFVSPLAFSPFPFDSNGSIPTHPEIAFRLAQGYAGEQTWVMVRILDDEGNVVDDVLPATQAAPGQLAWSGLHWDGLRPTGVPVAPGTYRVSISATDKHIDGPAFSLPGDRSDHGIAIHVGSRPPSNGCVFVLTETLGEQSSSPCNPRMSLRADSFPEGEEDRKLVLQVRDDDLGQARIAYLFKAPLEGTEWTLLQPDGPGFTYTVDVDHEDGFRTVVLFEDRSGNVECHPSCGALAVAPSPGADLGHPLEAQAALGPLVAAKVAAGGFAEFRVDIEPPVLLGLEPQELPLNVTQPAASSGGTLNTSLTSAVRTGPNSQVSIRFRIAEDVPAVFGQPPVGNLTWISAEPATNGLPCQHTALVTGEGPSAAGEYFVNWSAWDALVEEPSCPDGWPEGGTYLAISAADAAGNLAPSKPGYVVFDRTPPTLSDLTFEYPHGQRFAVPGDTVNVTVDARDAAVDQQPVPNKALRLVVHGVPTDAATLPGACGSWAFCFVPQAQAFRAQFTVPPNATGPELSISFEAVDTVGNVQPATLALNIGSPDYGIRAGPVTPGVGSADVSYRTNASVLGTLLYGTSPDDLDRSAQSCGGGACTEHLFHLEGLDPGVPHYYRFRGLSPDSLVPELSALPPEGLPSFEPLFGVGVAFLGPAPGAILSGVDDIVLEAGMEAPPACQAQVATTCRPTVTLLLLGRNGDAPIPLFSGTPQDGSLQAGLIVQRLATEGSVPDGVYDLVAHAAFPAQGGERAKARVDDVRVDNTPPEAMAVAPRPDAVLAALPRTLVLGLTDAGSGFGCDDAGTCAGLRLRIGGATVPVVTTLDRNGASDLLRVQLPAVQAPQGPVHIEAEIEDRAGNPTRLDLRVVLDNATPDAASASVLYPPGQEAARPGQAVRLLVVFDSAGGIDHATADLRPLGGAEAAVLEAGPSGHVVDALIPSAMADGAVVIPFKATSLAGVEGAGEAVVAIDSKAPTILSARLVPTGPATATLDYGASEPVRVSVRVAEGDLALAESGQTKAFTDVGTVPLKGLESGHAYHFVVRAVDRAGNEATSELTATFASIVATPTQVQDLRAGSLADGVRLQWRPLEPLGAFRYTVYRSDGGPFQLAGNSTAGSFEDRGLAPVPHRYFVVASNLLGALGPESQVVDAVPGSSPELEASVFPGVGLAGHTVFVFRADLRGAQEAQPQAWLVLDGVTYTLEHDGLDCRLVCGFSRSLTLPALTLERPESRYHIELLDGGQLSRIPDLDAFKAPEVLAEASAVEEAGLGIPAPGLALAPLLLFAALRRRHRR